MRNIISKFFFTLLLLAMSIGSVWGDTFTAAEIAAKSGDVNVGTTKNHITVSSPGVTSVTNVRMYKSGGDVKADAVVINSSSTLTDVVSTPYLSIQVDRGYKITSASFYGGANNSSDKKAEVFCWNSLPVSATYATATEITLKENDGTSQPADQTITLTGSTRAVRIYTKIKYGDATNGVISSAGTQKGGGNGAIVSVTATAALAPEIEGDSQMLNDESITLTGYPTGGSWAVVSGPGAIDSDGKLTASENGTIRVSYTYSDVSVTKDITVAATKTLVWTFDTNGTLPTTAGITVTNVGGTFESGGQLKLGTNGNYAYIDLTSLDYAVTAAVINGKTGSTGSGKNIGFGSAASDTQDGTTADASESTYVDYNVTPTKSSSIFSVIKTSGTSAYIARITLTVQRAVPAATYTVTLNPAGGSISPVPSGWTLTDGKYVKSGIEDGSSVALLALTKDGYKLNGWKDGENTDYTSPVTIDGADLTLTAQWAQTYAVTYVPNNGVLPAETMTDSNAPYKAGDEVTLLANTFTAPENKEFDAWVVTETVSGDPVTVTAGKFTMPAAAVTVTATWKDACALAPTVSATTLGTTSYTTQVVNCAGISVLGSAGCTISEYGFVYGTATAPTISDNKKALEGDYTVAGTAFPATTITGLALNTKYYVRAYATNSFGTAYGDEVNFTTLAALGNVLVVASSASQTSDAITALRDNGFVVTVSAPNNSRDYTGYDLVVLDESLDGKNGVAEKEEGDIKGVNIPLLNMKAFFYTLSSRWNWGSPVNGTSGNEIANIPATYKNAQSHPIFAGLTITDGAIDLIDPAKSGNTLQGVTTSTLVEGKEGYTLATSGAGITFIHELTPAQRGVSTAKYLMIAISSNAKDNLSDDGKKLIVNAAKYLVGSTAWVPQYYTVSFNTHGADAIEPLTGNPSITLPTPVNGPGSFLGWFTEETEGTKIGNAGVSYTPTADITLHAQWETISTDARLASITFSSDAGTLSPAFDPDVVNYTYTMPYPTASVPTITGATAVNANAKAPVIDAQAAAWGDVAHIHGVAESDATKDYYITMKIAPKDGVCIIKGNVGNDTFVIDEEASLFAGTADKNNVRENSSTYDTKTGWKFQARPARLGLTLSGDETFQEGDVVEVFVTSVANISGANDKMRIFDANDATSTHVLAQSAEDMIQGANRLVLPATTTKSLYLHRSNGGDYDNFNPFVAYVAVYRAMNPVLTAISFNSTDVDVTSTTVAATLPQGTNLGTMTVTPTIVWNGAGTAAPTAAWAWGDNTYRVTDKDGDYTDYTITLTEALAPSADPTITTQPASANYYEGATIAALTVEATGSGDLSYQWYLGSDEIDGATNATYTPTVTAIGTYVYHCVVTNTEAGHPATSLATDNATITIAEDPAAIKLLNGDGSINTTNFTTGVTAGTVNFDDADHNCASFGSTGGSIVGLTGLNKVVAYNATTTQTKVKFALYNTNSSPKELYLQKVLEGATEAVTETISVPSQERFETQYYVYNSSDLRSFYVTVNSTNIKILQVTVVEDGTVLKRVGEAGYELNMNLGRVLGAQNTETTFESMVFEPSSNAKVLNSTELPIVKPLSFTISYPVTLSVTTSAAKYYVSQDDEEDGSTATEITVAGTEEFSLTLKNDLPTTWYIVPSTSSAVKLTNIAFTAPKCAEPAFNALANSEICSGDPYVALDGTGTVSDGGSITYKWYAHGADESDPAAILATTATYTPTADGTYYVKALHHVDGYTDNEATSDEVTVTTFASAQITTAPTDVRQEVGQVATLNVVATGKAPLGYQWYTCDDAEGNNPVIITGAEEDSYSVTVTANLDQYYKVVVSSGCGSTSAVAKIVEWVELPQLNVSTTTTWNWVDAGENIKLTSGTTPAKDEECVMANVKVGGKMPTNDATFNSQALLFSGENVRAKDGGRYYASLGHIKFNAAVSGKVTVEFSDNGTNDRRLKINEALSESSSSKTDIKTFSAIVPAGEVTLMGVNNDGSGSDRYIRISKIIFSTTDVDGADYTRDLTQGRYGTICLPNGGVMVGADLFEIAYYGETSQKIFFDQIMNGVMEAGVPYVFLPREGASQLGVYYTDSENAPAGSRNGLIGSYTQEIVTPNDGNYILLNNQYCFVNSTAYVGANRAYIKLSNINPTEPALAPGRIRMSMGVVGAPQVATGCENIEASDKPTKVMINGQLFIIRGEKTFDATGRLVK